MQLQRNVAFAHFKASGLDIPQSGVDITISGENIPAAASISYMNELTISPGEILVHADAEGDFYVAFPLADDNMHFSPTFSAKVGDKTYTCTLIREKAWTRGEYVREAPGKGITVEFTPVVDDDADADLVGPVFEVNGRKFRFLRANLAYNVPENAGTFLITSGRSFARKAGQARMVNGRPQKWMTSTSLHMAAPVFSSLSIIACFTPRPNSMSRSTLRNISPEKATIPVQELLTPQLRAHTSPLRTPNAIRHTQEATSPSTASRISRWTGDTLMGSRKTTEATILHSSRQNGLKSTQTFYLPGYNHRYKEHRHK